MNFVRENYSRRTQRVIDYLESHPEGVTPLDVAGNVPSFEGRNNDAGNYLRRLVRYGVAHRDSRGVYFPGGEA